MIYKDIYTESYLVAVGIDKYRDPVFSPLGSAEEDARALVDLLSNSPYNFRTTLLLGPKATKANILDALNDLFNTDPDSRILFYFAGHGYTIENNFGHETGYLACADTLPQRHYTAMRMDEVTSLREHAKAKHIAFIFDACFSGQALGMIDLRGATDKLLERRAYQVLSAGAGDQAVSDQHSMTRLLIDVLNPTINTIRLTEVALRVQEQMTHDTRSTQIPQLGHLTGSQGGDFVFYEGIGSLLPSDVLLALDSEQSELRKGAVNQLIELAESDGDDAASASAMLAELANRSTVQELRFLAERYFEEKKEQEKPDLLDGDFGVSSSTRIFDRTVINELIDFLKNAHDIDLFDTDIVLLTRLLAAAHYRPSPRVAYSLQEFQASVRRDKDQPVTELFRRLQGKTPQVTEYSAWERVEYMLHPENILRASLGMPLNNERIPKDEQLVFLSLLSASKRITMAWDAMWGTYQAYLRVAPPNSPEGLHAFGFFEDNRISFIQELKQFIGARESAFGSIDLVNLGHNAEETINWQLTIVDNGINIYAYDTRPHVKALNDTGHADLARALLRDFTEVYTAEFIGLIARLKAMLQAVPPHV